MTWSLFRGAWPWLPDFRTLKPARRGQTKSVNLTMAAGVQPFGIAFEGYFFASQPDEYTFNLSSSGGAMLFLHDIRVIGEPIRNPAGRFSGSVRLSAGWHPIRLYHRQSGAGKSLLELTCRRGATGEYNLPPDVFRPMSANG